ncbi:hypothetical protein P3X46_022654 [Hevea brasiliensis]|uniref:Uncharacterized protein n=1 Tax=Hevea brasiliensis TaxID=3981 RepID=A0ABQ9L8J8_HEVBR|nr:hypothetical protein P3X46_022654 [Hevea brasiliensis]
MGNDSPRPPSSIGIEGFEKRLEIIFTESPIFKNPTVTGLRSLTWSQLDSILEPAFDLFILPLKIVIKTCEITNLLLSIEQILKLAESLSLIASDVKYSRGNFIFPNYQPAPDRSFSKEGSALKEFFECLNAEAYVLLGNPNHKWHIYSASRKDRTDMITVEMCQTSLDQKKAAVFFKRLADYSAKDLSRNSGISEILRSHVICDFAMGFDPSEVRLNSLANRVLRCFGPGEFYVAITCHCSGVQGWAVECGDVDGCWCRMVVTQELESGSGCVVYRSYDKKEKGHVVVASPAKVSMQCWKEVAEEKEDVVVGGGGVVVCP